MLDDSGVVVQFLTGTRYFLLSYISISYLGSLQAPNEQAPGVIGGKGGGVSGGEVKVTNSI